MRIFAISFALAIIMTAVVLVFDGGRAAAASATVPAGQAAYSDWHSDAPGVRFRITPADLPPPFATASVGNGPRVVDRPDSALPRVPPGFVVTEFAHLEHPRLVRVAPDGDIFVAESHAGKIVVLRAPDGAPTSQASSIYAEGLDAPFGIAFWPPGPNPRYVYVANTGSVVRFPYQNGDLKARGPAQLITSEIPSGGWLRGGGHWTRDIVFSPDGQHLFVSVGSASNDAESFGRDRLDALMQYASAHPPGALFGAEEHRADILEFGPDGGAPAIYATGLRNCVGMAINPVNGELWCSTNERDGLGDNLPPDYITHVEPGGFYGWPWYYIGDHEDPRHRGERPDLKGKVITPDVLLQPHSASLEMVFYTGSQFPAEYRNDIFAAEHGSWNRAMRTGYKVIRVLMKNGHATGEYEDFMTGMVASDADVWGRPVGVAVAHDGALIVTEDGNGYVWRIAWRGASTPGR
ncbi:MAG TPA: sorbosone dehydrogenase family protein [Candidatus Binataceae bacterium]|nr:sorbosone dehydrogenase family protein [Candidatus Binataceae bacterium]